MKKLRENIFNDSDNLVKVWQTINDKAYLQIGYVRENIKFFSMLIVALIMSHATILAVDPKIFNPILKGFSLVIVSTTLIILTFSGLRSVKRDYRRFLELIAYSAKLEELLGLLEQRKTKLFEKDNYIIPKIR